MTYYVEDPACIFIGGYEKGSKGAIAPLLFEQEGSAPHLWIAHSYVLLNKNTDCVSQKASNIEYSLEHPKIQIYL